MVELRRLGPPWEAAMTASSPSSDFERVAYFNAQLYSRTSWSNTYPQMTRYANMDWMLR